MSDLAPIPDDLPPFAAFAGSSSEDAESHEYEDIERAILHERAVASRVLGFRLGRLSAHRALRQLGRDDGPILSGPAREPLWPPGIAGSISHAGTYAVALAAPLDRTDGVGIDIEERRPVPELAGQVPRSEERDWIQAAPAEDHDELVLALFSAKESIFKAFYPRVERFFGFEAASLVPAPGGFRARLVSDLDSKYPADRQFHVGCRWGGDFVLSWLILPCTEVTGPTA
jgi:4'-phosphopantetheinyl transferase EntD